MLEIKNLTKVYQTRGGAPVKALDDVSLSFGETGMVFLLGKSGSGKSTLLNVIGGLDVPTDGEIIVKGRSSKKFSQSDFDSYRNTFIGFIFQEYNILNEFSVEDNIALALELQGKPKDKKVIAELLEQVDLSGYAKRKPNTLSGGQKQRIAIARALVKSPQIIMADEPTGALDSNTGRQVFETMKNLSRDKLVLVVSHDRDFAEQYGDRIIELKDGKVISDVSKTQLKEQAVSDNVFSVGDVLRVKKGSELNEEDLRQVCEFLRHSNSETVLARGEKDVNNFKKMARIHEDGNRDSFSETDESAVEKKTYTKEESRFLRSKLPQKHAFKIGVSGMKSKPIRLLVTTILCTVAFAMFGLLSTLSFYDSESTFYQTLRDGNTQNLQVNKRSQMDYVFYEYGQEVKRNESEGTAWFSPSDVEKELAALSPDAFGALTVYTDLLLCRQDSRYWDGGIYAYAYLPEGNALRQQIEGEYPKSNNEIVLSSYLIDVLCQCGTLDEKGEEIRYENPSEWIGKNISIYGREYRITGILNSGALDPQFDPIKENNATHVDLLAFESYLHSGYHSLAFMTQEEIQAFFDENGYDGYREYRSLYAKFASRDEDGYLHDFRYQKGDQIRNAFYFEKGKTSLNKGEILLSPYRYLEFANLFYDEQIEALYMEEQQGSLSFFEQDALRAQIHELERKREMIWRVWEDATFTENGERVPFTDEERKAAWEELFAELDPSLFDLKMELQNVNPDTQAGLGEVMEMRLVGVAIGNRFESVDYIYTTYEEGTALWSEQRKTMSFYQAEISKYVRPADAIYDVGYLPFTSSDDDALRAYWEAYTAEDFKEDGTKLYLFGGVLDTLRMVDSMIQSLSEAFLYIGIGFAVFAILLFSNLISVSISQKKRDIGILRAVGARSADVFRIFFSESFVVALICVMLSLVGSIVACHFINLELIEMIGLSLLVFGPLSILVLVGVAVLTAFLATFLPVYHAAKKKPVESIRAL